MNKTKTKEIVIIAICIAAALICIVLTFWGNWKNNGVLTTDAFVGVLATFMGICATIIVGIQIVSFIELREMRNQIKAIQEERKLLNEQRDAFSIEMYNTRLGLGNALALMALTAKKNNDLVIEFESLVISIIIDDWSSMDGLVLLKRYQRLSDIANTFIPNCDKDYIHGTLKKLSILKVPKDIKHYDGIMSLHYQLLSLLKSNVQPPV